MNCFTSVLTLRCTVCLVFFIVNGALQDVCMHVCLCLYAWHNVRTAMNDGE